jgi:hypothetical protein
MWWQRVRNLDSCCCWRCTVYSCTMKNIFLVNFLNRTILLWILCIDTFWRTRKLTQRSDWCRATACHTASESAWHITRYVGGDSWTTTVQRFAGSQWTTALSPMHSHLTLHCFNQNDSASCTCELITCISIAARTLCHCNWIVFMCVIFTEHTFGRQVCL